MPRGDAVQRTLRLGGLAVGLVVAGLVLSIVLPDYYVYLGTSAVVAAISLLGLGVVTGSAGMIALCQLSFAAIGAWIVSALNLVNAPGGAVLWLVAGAAAGGVAGVLVGLPALRLRGVNLAVVTLGFAAAIQLTVTDIEFPGATSYVRVLPPPAFSTDALFFVFSVIVLAVCAVAVQLLRETRPGSGWRFVAFSERGLASAGGGVRTTKLSAFAVSAALGGLSGGLVVMQVGLAQAPTFSPLQSLALYLLAVVVGSHLVDMAIFGGVLWVAVPEVLRRLGVDQNWALVLFGAAGVQALTSRSNLGQQIRDAVARRRRTRRTGMALGEAAARTLDGDAAAIGGAVLETRGLGQRFGSVVALDGVDLTVHAGEIVGLIGPNGAGKSTLIDALSGFLPAHSGQVLLRGEDMAQASPTRLARAGLRRTFQQDRVPPSLDVAGYVRFVSGRRLRRVEVDEALAFFGLPDSRAPLTTVDVGTRRIVEIAAQLAARPAVLLLDEPAAGLSHEEHIALGDQLRRVPARFGTALLLIEHDLDLVRRVSDSITVLDFGRVLASGDRDAVLDDPKVVAAYMGEAALT